MHVRRVLVSCEQVWQSTKMANNITEVLPVRTSHVDECVTEVDRAECPDQCHLSAVVRLLIQLSLALKHQSFNKSSTSKVCMCTCVCETCRLWTGLHCILQVKHNK